MHKSVYLAGKIEGLTWDQAAAWRKWAAKTLRDAGIRYYDPCEHVPISLRKGAVITGKRAAELSGLRGDEIWTQDVFYLKNETNIILANLWDYNTGKLTGTLVEWGMGYILGLTLIGFRPSDSYKGHPFIYKPADCLFETVEEAVDFIIAM